MIRKKTGLKELTLVMLCGAALVSVACGDDDDGGDGGMAGSTTAGTSAAGSKNTGGSAGSKNTGGSAGTSTGGTTSAGTSSGGTAGSPEGGMPSGGVPSEGGSSGEGGAPVGGADAGGAGGEGGATEVVLDTLKNGSFEVGNPGGSTPPDSGTKVFPEWVNTATPDGSSYVQWGDPVTGSVRLAHWDDVAYVATVEQTVKPIANGTYFFSIMVKRAGAALINDSYLYARGFDVTDLEDEETIATDEANDTTYEKITLGPITVTSGELTVGVKTDALAQGWVNFDDAELVFQPE